MTNIPYPKDKELDAETRALVAAIPPLNLIKVMSYSPGNVNAIVRLSDSVLNRGVLDPVVRQIALIRLTVVVGSSYERTLLESVSLGEGMSDQLIAAAREGSMNETLTELQRMAARLAEELAGSPRPSKATFEYLKSKLPTRHLVELVQAIGFYLMQTRTIETFEISLEDPPVDLSRRLENADQTQLEAWRKGQ